MAISPEKFPKLPRLKALHDKKYTILPNGMKAPYIYVPPRRNKTRSPKLRRRSMLTGRWYPHKFAVDVADAHVLFLRDEENRAKRIKDLEVARANGHTKGARRMQANGLRNAFRENYRLSQIISDVRNTVHSNPYFDPKSFQINRKNKKNNDLVKRNGVIVAKKVYKTKRIKFQDLCTGVVHV